MLNEALIMSVEPQALTLKYKNEYLYLKDSILSFIFENNFDNLVMKQANFLGMYLEGSLGHDTNISLTSINTSLPFIANLDPNKSKFRNGKTITLALSRKYQHAQGYETYWYLFIYIDIDTQALTNRSKNSFARMHLEFYSDIQNKNFRHSNQYIKVMSNPVWLDKKIDSTRFIKIVKMLIEDGILSNRKNLQILGSLNLDIAPNNSTINLDSTFFGVDFKNNNALKDAFANSVFKPKLRELWLNYISEDDMFSFWSVSKQDYINEFDIISKIIDTNFCLTFSIHPNSMYEIALIFDYDSNQKKASLTFGILLNDSFIYKVPYKVYLKSEAITANLSEIPYFFSDRYLQMSTLESYYRLLQTKILNEIGNFDMYNAYINTLVIRGHFNDAQREIQDDILFLLVKDISEFKVIKDSVEMVDDILLFKYKFSLISDSTISKEVAVMFTFKSSTNSPYADCSVWFESTKLVTEKVPSNDNEGFLHAMLKTLDDIVKDSNNSDLFEEKIIKVLKTLIPVTSNNNDNNKTILDVLPVESNRSMTALALLGVLNDKLWIPNNYVDTLGALNFQSLDYDIDNNDAEFVFNFGNNNKLSVYNFFGEGDRAYYLKVLINGVDLDSPVLKFIDTTYLNSGKAIKDALIDFLESPINLSKLTEGLNSLIRSQALDLPQNTKTVGQIINELKSKLQSTWSNKVSSLDYLSSYRRFYDLKIMSYDNRSLEINSPITDFLNNRNLPLRLSFGNQRYRLDYAFNFEKFNQDIKCKVELIIYYDPSDTGRAEYTDTYTKIYERSIDMTNSDNWLQLIYFAITSTLPDLLNDSAFDRI